MSLASDADVLREQARARAVFLLAGLSDAERLALTYAVVVAALECVREIAAPANDNAHSATVTDLSLYRSVAKLQKACESLLASMPVDVRRAA